MTTEESEHTEYHNAVVVIGAEYFKDYMPRLFQITGGKITVKGMMGCSMFGYYLNDEKQTIVREEPRFVIRFATEEEKKTKKVNISQTIKRFMEYKGWYRLFHQRLFWIEEYGVSKSLMKQWKEQDKELEGIEDLTKFTNKIEEFVSELEH